MVEPLLSGIVLGLITVTAFGLFVAAFLQYRRRVKRSEIVEEEAVKTYVVKKWCMRTKSAYHSHSRSRHMFFKGVEKSAYKS
jgi:hypothetical protein